MNGSTVDWHFYTSSLLSNLFHCFFHVSPSISKNNPNKSFFNPIIIYFDIFLPHSIYCLINYTFFRLTSTFIFFTASSLIKLGQLIPDLMFANLPGLCERVNTLLQQNMLLPSEQSLLFEMLVLVSNSFSNFSKQSTFLDGK